MLRALRAMTAPIPLCLKCKHKQSFLKPEHASVNATLVVNRLPDQNREQSHVYSKIISQQTTGIEVNAANAMLKRLLPTLNVKYTTTTTNGVKNEG